MEGFRGQRRESQEGGRTVFTEPGRVIVRDPSGQSFIRHNEVDRFRYGARDIRTERVGNDTRTIVIRPDGTQIITVNDRNGQLLRRSAATSVAARSSSSTTATAVHAGVAAASIVGAGAAGDPHALQPVHRQLRGSAAGTALRDHDGAAGGTD